LSTGWEIWIKTFTGVYIFLSFSTDSGVGYSLVAG